MCGRRVVEKWKESGSGTEEAYESKMVGWSEIADCALPQTMTRSSKTPNGSQPRNVIFGALSAVAVAVAVAVLFLLLCLQSGSLASNPSPPKPQGNWRQVHRALGISLAISPTGPQEQAPIKLSSVYNLPLRLVEQGGNPESPKDKADSLQELTAALRSISGKPKRMQ